MKEQKSEKPEPVQKPLRQGQPEEARVTSADDKADAAGGNGARANVEGASVRALPSGPKPQRPEAIMQSDPLARKNRGRLTRDAMKIIGKTLEAYYDDVRKEGTPDRFKELLQQYDERTERKDKEPG